MPWGPRLGRDRRAASEVLGAILVFAILITAIGVFQVTVVPQTNQEVEFEHSTQVRGGMQEVRSALLRAGTAGTPGSVTVRTGVSYPTRILAVNPQGPRGRLRTTAPVGAVNLTGVTASDPEAGDFWNGTHNFTSRSLVYRPAYNYYDGAPTVAYEPTVLYSSFPDGGEIIEGSGGLVDGRTLNVVLVAGEVAAGGGTATVEAKPVSASTRTVRIEDPGVAVVKTRLSQSAWQDLLAGEPASVEDFSRGSPNTVVVDLEPGTWRLNVANVSVGRSLAAPGPAYLEAVGDTRRTVSADGTAALTVRALDRYGNPVEGATVNQTFASNRTTGPDGTVTYEYVAGSGNETLDVWVGSAAPPADPARAVTFEVNVSRGGIGQQVNPSEGLVVRSATIDGTYGIDVTVESTGGDTTVRAFRVNYYHANGQGNSASVPPEDWRVNGSPTRRISGRAIEVDDGAVPAGTERTFAFQFVWSGDGDVQDSDLLVLTARFEDGTSRIYFVSPK
jgi:hypothetical protein